MDSLPVLPGLTQRKLAVLWDITRDKLQLTDGQVSSYDRERQRLTAITGIGSDRAQREVRTLGLYSSTRLAEQRFKAFDAEYWPLWRASSMRYGWYQSWLTSLTRSIVGELASIWMGRSDATDRWFEYTCRPELERALSRVEGKRIAQARSVEIQSTETRTLPYPPQESVPGFQPGDVMPAQDQTYSRYGRSREAWEPASPGGAVEVGIPVPRTRMPPPGRSLEQMAGTAHENERARRFVRIPETQADNGGASEKIVAIAGSSAYHEKGVQNVKKHFGSEGVAPFVEFYSKINPPVTHPEFAAWKRNDPRKCGKAKWTALDKAANDLA
jgi:hypothetical protein